MSVYVCVCVLGCRVVRAFLHVDLLVFCAALQIYMELIQDLLKPESDNLVRAADQQFTARQPTRMPVRLSAPHAKLTAQPI